jgi:hypothetical protein
MNNMKMNKIARFCMGVLLVALVFSLGSSISYGQDTSNTGDNTYTTNTLPNYDDVRIGYEIRGQLVLAEPDAHGAVNNIALGNSALVNNTTGSANTASGAQALLQNTEGSFNTANGFQALLNNTGDSNTASGVAALIANTSGSNNTGMGDSTFYNSTTGSNNTALGFTACYNVVTGSNIICIGSGAGPASDITGPATYIANIYGAATTGSGNPLVCIDSTGLLGTTNCATSGQEVIEGQRAQIEALQKQNEEFQRRLSRLEALIAKK